MTAVQTSAPPAETGSDQRLADYLSARIAEFFDRPYPEVRALIEEVIHHHGLCVARAWREADPKTDEEITRFYQETDAYIYDLSAAHCRASRQAIWAIIERRIAMRGSGQRVLLYGDGIGLDSISLARLGHFSTYFDLPGKTADFAAHCIKQAELPDRIQIIRDVAEVQPKAYDAVVCIEVLEHVPDPIGVMRTIHRALKPGGIAIITESFESVSEEFPSHLESNLAYVGKTHHLMESLGFANTYYNRNPVNYPMEFTKIGSTAPGYLLYLTCRVRRMLDTRIRALAARHK